MSTCSDGRARATAHHGHARADESRRVRHDPHDRGSFGQERLEAFGGDACGDRDDQRADEAGGDPGHHPLDHLRFDGEQHHVDGGVEFLGRPEATDARRRGKGISAGSVGFDDDDLVGGDGLGSHEAADDRLAHTTATYHQQAAGIPER